mmetsp:Transcript_3972/g.13838  ORF Transcript_3972/g.13838 Transcript_3972/m.13838 type:complete len:344 (+) Transcript_3972:173-1204(+)|eukprot:30612-Pelagococcus_subviridis.AAC.3
MKQRQRPEIEREPLVIYDHLRGDQRQPPSQRRERRVVRPRHVRRLVRVVREPERDAHARLHSATALLAVRAGPAQAASPASAPMNHAMREDDRGARLRGRRRDVLIRLLARQTQPQRVLIHRVRVVVVAHEVPWVVRPRDEVQARVLGRRVRERDPRGGVHGGAVVAERRGRVVGLPVAVRRERGRGGRRVVDAVAVVHRVHVPAQRVEVEPVPAGDERDHLRELRGHHPRLVEREQERRVPSVLREAYRGRREQTHVRDVAQPQRRRGKLRESVSQDAVSRRASERVQRGAGRRGRERCRRDRRGICCVDGEAWTDRAPVLRVDDALDGGVPSVQRRVRRRV